MVAHITLPPGMPGITGPMAAYPETERPLNALAQALLRGESSLTTAERETIATYVSAGNECFFCTNAHAATARYIMGEDAHKLDEYVLGMEQVPPANIANPKMQMLLTIAEKVRKDGRLVNDEDIAAARAAGADDKAIHDTVLIAAAFSMFNRYVDGLNTFTPTNPEDYKPTGEMLGSHGYINSIRPSSEEN